MHHFSRIQNAQQTQLNRVADVSDFVQKQRSAVGQFKQTLFAAAFGTGKRSFFITEEFALQ